MKKVLLLLAVLLLGGALFAADLLQGLNTRQVRVSNKGKVRVLAEKGKTVLEIAGTPTSRDPKRSQYLSFTITLPETLSLEKKTVKLGISCKGEPPAPALYVRAYNDKAKKPVWSFFVWNSEFFTSPQEITLTALRNRKLTWEKKMISGEPADKVRKLEFFIGTKKVNNPQTIRITRLEVVPELDLKDDPMPKQSYRDVRMPLPELKKVVVLPEATAIVKAGKACAILLHPDTPEGKKAAKIVTDAIRKVSGVSISARPGTPADRTPGGTVIMMGNLVSNPAMQVLYSRYQTAADEFLPGEGGYTIETIVEPFVRHKDVIVLGASGNAGMFKGAEAFAELVKKHGKPGELILPVTFKTEYKFRHAMPKYNENYISNGIRTAHDRLKNGSHTSLGGQLAQIGTNYLRYRNSMDAKLYAEVAKIYVASAKGDPRKFGGPWGFDSDFPSFEAIGGWDLIEHDPALTAEDRLAVSNMILRWTHEAIFAEARGGLRSKGPVGNHLTHCSMGALMSALYFGKYYSAELPHPAFWLDTVKKNFARQYVHGKAMDDCDSYHWLTWRHVFVYALALPDETVFRNGVADQIIKVAGTTMDNLGAQTPYGDTNVWRSSASDMIVLKMLYAATGNPLVNYMLQMKKPFDFRRNTPSQYFRKTTPAAVPADLDGVTVIKLDPGYYKYAHSAKPVTPLEKCFDKFSFREKLDPQALYILVDGVNNGGHGHNDANSVLRFTQFGREWLAENEYVKNQQKYHNSLLIYCNGEAFPLPAYMELVDQQDKKDVAVMTVRANRLGKCDWTRHYIWLKQEKAWMLIDEVAAREAGTFRMIQRWNGVGARTARPDGYELEQAGVRMRLQTSADLRLSTYDDADLGRQWGSYPHAQAVIRVMDQTAEKDLSAGEKVRMAAVWHGAASGDVPEWAVERSGEGFRVHTGKTLYTVSVQDGGRVAVAKSALEKPVPPRRNLAKSAAAINAPAIRAEWKLQLESNVAFRLTEREIRSLIPVKLTGTTPQTAHLFFPNAKNRMGQLWDGAWSEGPDSVMFARNQKAVLNFAFREPQKVNGVELQTWWGTSPRFSDLPFRIRSMEVRLSNDNFRKDNRKVAFYDSSSEGHSGFGSTIPYVLTFKEQQAQQVRVIITPVKDGAVYLGEAAVLGSPAEGLPIRKARENFTRVIRVEEKGGDYLAASSMTGRLVLLTPDGREFKSIQIISAIHDLVALDVDKDGKKELILVCKDGYCRVIRPDGREVWKFKFPYYRLFPSATIVRIADLDNDGEPEIIVGCDNWRTYVLDRNGREIWNYEVVRQTRSVKISDLDGDGKQELICGTAYMTATVLTHKGYRVWGGRFGHGCRASAAPLNGDGRNRTVVLGLDNGNVNFYNKKGGVVKTFHTGDEIFMMTETLEANGKQDIYVCSYNGFVYRLTAEGSVVWSRALPASAVRIVTLPDGGVAAGTIDGDVCLLTADGRIRGHVKLNGSISDLTVDGRRLLVTSGNGDIAALKL
ncbi:MAG: hypothetical protein IJC34_06685 [Lentisphaeria bacterium]|nr:hypothetical protein [Lentisphaeria bacterium]